MVRGCGKGGEKESKVRGCVEGGEGEHVRGCFEGGKKGYSVEVW